MNTKPKSKLSTSPTRLAGSIPVMNSSTEESNNTKTNLPDYFVLDEDASPTPVETKKVSYEYKVIATRDNLDMFQLTVSQHLNSGWELSGGVSCTMYADSYSAATIWSQALYKKTSN